MKKLLKSYGVLSLVALTMLSSCNKDNPDYETQQSVIRQLNIITNVKDRTSKVYKVDNVYYMDYYNSFLRATFNLTIDGKTLYVKTPDLSYTLNNNRYLANPNEAMVPYTGSDINALSQNTNYSLGSVNITARPSLKFVGTSNYYNSTFTLNNSLDGSSYSVACVDAEELFYWNTIKKNGTQIDRDQTYYVTVLLKDDCRTAKMTVEKLKGNTLETSYEIDNLALEVSAVRTSTIDCPPYKLTRVGSVEGSAIKDVSSVWTSATTMTTTFKVANEEGDDDTIVISSSMLPTGK